MTILVLIFILTGFSACGDGGGVPLGGPGLVSVTVSPTDPSVAMGAAYQFKATGRYSDSSTRDVTDIVVWTSTDTAKANISAAGLVTLNAPGPTIIRATSGGVTGETELTVRSNSNAVNLSRTGQIDSQAAGDDGNLQRGVSPVPPNPRFTMGTGGESGCVTDNLTGLMWPINANLPSSSKTWQQALDYVATTANAGAGLCGHTDWRLPNRKELRSLIDYSRYGPALQSGHPFTGVQGNYYWSSTTYSGYTVNAWAVSMLNGYLLGSDKSSTLFVWPVRAGQ